MRFKNYKQNGTVTVIPDTIANQLITTYNIQNPYDFSSEGYLNIIMHSSLDEIDATLPGIITALTFLNKKLEASRKTISFWDAYQIKETIEDKEQMLGQLSNMPVNTSIVSNLRDPFTWLNESNQQETIYRGDLLIKDYNGRIHLIHGTSQGSYKPVEPTQSGQSYTLNYTYVENALPGDEAHTEITLSGKPQGYNIHRSLNPDAYIQEDTIDGITPVVKYYYTVLNNSETLYEQVIIDKSFLYFDDEDGIELHNPTSVQLIAEVK